MIDISKMDKAEVFAALYNAAKSQGMGVIAFSVTPSRMTRGRALEILESTPSKYFDYVNGRVMKVDLSGDTLDEWGYDRDNGQGAAARAIEGIGQ